MLNTYISNTLNLVKKIYSLFFFIPIILYPFSIYGLKIGSTFISFSHISLFGCCILYFNSLLKYYYWVILALMFIYVPLFSVENSSFYEGSITTLIFLTFLFLYGVIIFDQVKDVTIIENIAKCIIFSSVVPAIYIFYEVFIWTIFNVTIKPPLCSITELLCKTDHASISNYMGGLLRPAGFFASVNRSGTFIIPAFLFSFYFYKKTKNHYYLFFFLFLFFINLITLSRLSILISLILLLIIFFDDIKKNSKFISFLKYELFLLSIIIYLIFVFLNPDHKLSFLRTGNINRELEYFEYLSRIYRSFINMNILSIEKFGFGIGYHHINDYYYHNSSEKLWGMHSNFLELLGGLGLIPLLILIFYFTKNFQLSFNDDLLKYINLTILSFIIYGTMKTFGLNIYGIVFFTIFLKYKSNK